MQPEDLIHQFQTKNLDRKLKQERVYRVHENQVQRFYKEKWENVCQHDNVTMYTCENCDSLVTDPNGLIIIFEKRNKKRKKLQNERFYRVSSDGSSVERLYKEIWNLCATTMKFLVSKTARFANPFQRQRGIQRWQWFIDRLQAEMGFPYNMTLQSWLETSGRKRTQSRENLRVDGFFVKNDGTNPEIEFLGTFGMVILHFGMVNAFPILGEQKGFFSILKTSSAHRGASQTFEPKQLPSILHLAISISKNSKKR